MKPLTDARIGYAGYSKDWSVPGDRRRFCAYARMRGLAVENARLDGDYDLVYLTHNADLPGWIARKRREHGLTLVLELVDSYLTQSGRLRGYAKGAVRRLLGTDSGLSLNFVETLRSACRAADAIICSTQEQAEMIRPLNPNAFVSFDWMRDELGAPKHDYRPGERLRLAWEGQAVTASNLQQIREPLNRLRDRVELHVITDPMIPRWLSRFGKRPTNQVLEGIHCPVRFHRWERDSFAKHAKACDVAVLPIALGNAMMRGKPENKMLLLWQLGLPALASPTPSYRRTLAAAGLEQLCCDSPADWIDALERIGAMDERERRALGERCRDFAFSAYSAEEFKARFDAAFERAGFRPADPAPMPR